MRILTVRQPWAWAIIRGGKDVENRTRNIAGAYRGPVAIHAAKSQELNAFSNSAVRDVLNSAADRWYDSLTPQQAGRIQPEPWRRDLGAIIGVVDLVDVHLAAKSWECELLGAQGCSPWAEPNANHLVLANPRPLTEPIPFRGVLGLRELDRGTEDEVWARR